MPGRRGHAGQKMARRADEGTPSRSGCDGQTSMKGRADEIRICLTRSEDTHVKQPIQCHILSSRSTDSITLATP